MSKKVAIVTGSFQGIGKGIADLLSKNDYQVIYSDVQPSMEGVEYVKCDISNADDRKNLKEYVEKKYGRLDLLVNNAGVACKVRMDILETTEESFDRLIRINTKGTFFMCQTFANFMIASLKKNEDYQPRIVNIASNSSYTSSVSRGEYCISKAGVSMVTTLFADKLGEYNIPVLEVRPGIIKTPMTEVVTAKYDKLINEGITPTKRWGQPLDIAKAVLAVAQGLLDFSTGTAINVDGG
ncbi:MAG: 3-ketoacyl-ACP reductase, partial [Bacilli bacterium]|nr:3-ketoacyl-ACP reductase [Bacilli bacterium]